MAILFQDDQSVYRRIETAAAGQVVGTVQVAVPHNLGAIPALVIIEATSNAVIWQSQAADANNVYLTASVAGATCNVRVAG